MIKVNPKEFVKDLIDSGATKEEALELLKIELAKRKIADAKNEQKHKGSQTEKRENSVNFK